MRWGFSLVDSCRLLLTFETIVCDRMARRDSGYLRMVNDIMHLGGTPGGHRVHTYLAYVGRQILALSRKFLILHQNLEFFRVKEYLRAPIRVLHNGRDE